MYINNFPRDISLRLHNIYKQREMAYTPQFAPI